MRFTNQVLSVSPAIITIGFVALFAVSGIAFTTDLLPTALWPIAYSTMMFAFLGCEMLWLYSLYRASSDRVAHTVGHNGKRVFLFVVAASSLSIFLMLAPTIIFSGASASTNGFAKAIPLFMVVGVLSLFASIWAAANALTRFEDDTKNAALHKTLGTFFLLFYLPIGIWALYPRIKRLLTATPDI